MKRKSIYIQSALLFFVSCMIHGYAHAQEIDIAYGKTEVALNEYFTITATMHNEQVRNYTGFPEIKGLVKEGVSSQSSTNIINGRMSFTQSITQNYRPQKEGKFKVPDFEMQLNGKAVKKAGITITVGPPVQRQRRQSIWDDPFQDVFEDSRPQDFVEIEDDAFFALTPSKKSVYAGEGFNVTVAFYVAKDNRAPMDFFEPGRQVAEMLKKIRPGNCWEENFDISEINGENIEIEGKPFIRFKLYEAVFYPLNTEPIKFPALPLKMLKYKVAKQQSWFGRNRIEDYKTFYSKPVTVTVKPLPEHPLKNSVPVGNFTLQEEITPRKTETGQTVKYTFGIWGEGNLAGLPKPVVTESDMFDIHEPNVKQNIRRERGAVFGNKNYSYYIIPNEPGNYKLRELFSMVYFDPVRARYDTLVPSATLESTGESKRNSAIGSGDYGGFYDRIETESNRFINPQRGEVMRLWANIVLFILLIASILLLLLKKKKTA